MRGVKTPHFFISICMVMTITNVTNPHCGYLKQFEHTVDLNSNGVLSTWIEWCNENCEHHWGWHFKWPKDEMGNKVWVDDDFSPVGTSIERMSKNTKAFMSFESYDEMILFKITHFST